MAVRVTTKLNLPRRLTQATTNFKSTIKSPLKRIIIKTILSGKSPVQGAGSYQAYSEGYIKRIQGTKASRVGKKKIPQGKQIRPVNLKLTGKMLKSLIVQNIRNGIVIEFKDEKAVFHDKDGAGKSKVIRRMLPEEGEAFTTSIQRLIINDFRKAIRRAFR